MLSTTIGLYIIKMFHQVKQAARFTKFHQAVNLIQFAKIDACPMKNRSGGFNTSTRNHIFYLTVLAKN